MQPSHWLAVWLVLAVEENLSAHTWLLLWSWAPGSNCGWCGVRKASRRNKEGEQGYHREAVTEYKPREHGFPQSEEEGVPKGGAEFNQRLDRREEAASGGWRELGEVLQSRLESGLALHHGVWGGQ